MASKWGNEASRVLDLDPGTPNEMKLFVDRTIALVYVAGKVVMSTRRYDLPPGRWGFFVSQGIARFRSVKITGLQVTS